MIENAALFEHGAEVLDDAVITREFVTEHSGMRSVVWHQQLDGIHVFGGVLSAHTTRRGELVNISSLFLPDIEGAVGLGRLDRRELLEDVPISPVQALAHAFEDIGEEISIESIQGSEVVPSGMTAYSLPSQDPTSIVPSGPMAGEPEIAPPVM